ncbi:MAG: hypothetical protein ABIR71_00475 [Chthoniobacterales bacterium]
MKIISLLTLLGTVTLALGQPAVPARANTERVAFSQHCFWTGEMMLGQIDGVVRTEAGFLEGREITVVDYDPARVSLRDLARRAKAAGVAERVHLPVGAARSDLATLGVKEGVPLDRSYRAAPASDQKKQIEGTPLARLQLTPEQATKVNAFARQDPAKALDWLTPAQREQLQARK